MNALRLDYIIKHESVKYIVKRYFIFWIIENIDGNKAGLYLSKRLAQNYCDLYNYIYTWGYRAGCMSVYNEIVGNNDLKK